MTPRRGPLAAVLVALLLALLAGCVSVPTAGRVEKVEGQQPGCTNCVDVEVDPPSPGDDPGQIVTGFLRANANYQSSYNVARQYLTREAAQTWKPEDGVRVYNGTTQPDGGDAVKLTGQVVGQVATDRSYSVREDDLTQRFTLVRQDGEWRISNPPPGLLVANWAFAPNYTSYDLFFVANGRPSDQPSAVASPVLVPDPVYLPRFRSQDQVASALVKALVAGPTRWLAPSVSSAIPPGTTLSVDSVTINDGIAAVPLSDTVLALPDAQRSLLAAQIVYTLKEALSVRGVAITVNQQGYRVPESDPTTLVVRASSISTQLDPVSPSAGDQLYAVRGGKVGLADASGELRPFGGNLGSRPVGSLAVSVTGAELAAVTTDRSRLLATPVGGTDAKTRTVLSGVSDLARPQFTRFGELWALGRQDGRQRLWRVVNRAEVVRTPPELAKGDLTAFSFSPDGVRVAFLERTAKGSRLLVARVNRGDTVDVEGVRELDTTQPGGQQLTQLLDLAWLDPTHVLVLGSAAKETAGPYAVSQDASTITDQGEALAWNPQQVAVLLRTQSAIVLSRGGQTWRDEGTTWAPFVKGVEAVAYPG